MISSRHTNRKSVCWPTLLLIVTAGLACPARAEEFRDLREFHVGMEVREMPAEGYIDIVCAADPDRMLAGWSDFAACPLDALKLHEVRFQYDESMNPLVGVNDKYGGTKVAGHPVVLTALIGDDKHLDGLKIDTDPAAYLYLRKKAFLFANQVKAHYGEDGWSCQQAPPAADEESVGGIFVKEHCEKTVDARHLILDRELFRHSGQPLKDFVGGTQLTILRSERAAAAE
jgi:hypothetical protein